MVHCVCATGYERASKVVRHQSVGSDNDGRQTGTLELNGSQIAAYVLIASAHLLNALPENPTDVIVGLMAWRPRHTADDAGAAADTASTHLQQQQAAARRVAPGTTTTRHTASSTATAVEHNNK